MKPRKPDPVLAYATFAADGTFVSAAPNENEARVDQAFSTPGSKIIRVRVTPLPRAKRRKSRTHKEK